MGCFDNVGNAQSACMAVGAAVTAGVALVALDFPVAGGLSNDAEWRRSGSS